MLDSALSFERLVKNPKTGSKESGGKTQVTWDNPLELEAYIDKLQAAADKLTSENRRLRKCHYNISDKVEYLLFSCKCTLKYSYTVFISSFSAPSPSLLPWKKPKHRSNIDSSI